MPVRMDIAATVNHVNAVHQQGHFAQETQIIVTMEIAVNISCISNIE